MPRLRFPGELSIREGVDRETAPSMFDVWKAVHSRRKTGGGSESTRLPGLQGTDASLSERRRRGSIPMFRLSGMQDV